MRSQGGEKDKAEARENWGGRRVTIGMDLGDRISRYCVFDGNGYLREGSVSTTPEGMKKMFGAMKPCRIAIEVGTHSPWVSAVLEELGYEVLVASAWEVRAIGKSKKRTTRWMREAGGMEAQIDLLKVRARAELVEVRTQLVNMVRGLVKSQGQRIRKCDADSLTAAQLRGTR